MVFRHVIQIIFFIFLLCLQGQALGADTGEDRPIEPKISAPSPDRGSIKPEKEAAKKYQWLFREKEEEQSSREVDQEVVLNKLDKEIKEARRIYLSGKLEAAMAAYRKVTDDYEFMLDEMPPAHSLLAQMEQRFPIFEEVVTKILGPLNAAPPAETAGEIFQLLERRRVCRRNLTLKKAGPVEFFDVSKNLLKDERQLQKRLMELRAEIPSADVRQKLEETKNSLFEVQKSLEKSSPRYTLFRRGSFLGLSKVSRNLLGKNELILDFNLLTDRIVIGVITSESAVYYQIAANRADVEREVLNLQEMLREFTQEGRSTFMGHAWKEPARRIYRHLIGKIPPLPEDKNTVFVIPDRSLWYLPFSIMLDPEDRPFGRDRMIASIPSVDMLNFLRSTQRSSNQSTFESDLLLFESIPWISTEEVREASSESPVRKKVSPKAAEEEAVERVILKNPVYPRPSEIVTNIQKMFKKPNILIGAAATFDRFINTKEMSDRVTIVAVPLAVNDKLSVDRQPTFFFSPNKNGHRVFDARTLFSMPLTCQLLILPVAWFEIKDADSISGEGPLLLSSGIFYSGSRMYLLNYSDPDWGADEHFLLTTLKKISEKVSPGQALAGYPRDISSALSASFAGKPPNWVGWILSGDPN
jgi:hypothetical protein